MNSWIGGAPDAERGHGDELPADQDDGILWAAFHAHGEPREAGLQCFELASGVSERRLPLPRSVWGDALSEHELVALMGFDQAPEPDESAGVVDYQAGRVNEGVRAPEARFGEGVLLALQGVETFRSELACLLSLGLGRLGRIGRHAHDREERGESQGERAARRHRWYLGPEPRERWASRLQSIRGVGKRERVVPSWGRSKRFGALLLLAGLAVLPGEAQAAGYELERTSASALGAELGTALALALGTHFLLPEPEDCAWCAPPGIDRALHHPAAPEQRFAIGTYSHVVSFGILPLGGVASLLLPPLTSAERDVHGLQNAAIFVEALSLNVALTVAVKKWIRRQRPAFYYGRERYTEFGERPSARYVSFFSGDTSVAFVAASAASTLAFMRGYASAPYVTAGGATLATGVALARVAADVHWPTDVFTGAVVGTSVGILLPILLHARKSRPEEGAAQPSAAPLPLLEFGGRF